MTVTGAFRCWYFCPFNPIPWKVGPLETRRAGKKVFSRIGREEEGANFKDSVREHLLAQGASKMVGDYHHLYLIFWRQREQYKDAADRTRTRNAADSTNMQKLTEDAIQDILIGNDRDNVLVMSQVGEQEIDTIPGVLIMLESFVTRPPLVRPPGFEEAVDRFSDAAVRAQFSPLRADMPAAGINNEWPPRPV